MPKKKAAAKKGPPRTTGYRVECESYPSGTGCYSGQDLSDDYIEACTTVKIVGEYDTMEEAKEAAIQERDYNCQFEDWAEEYYGDKDPPFFSSDGENYDEDENAHIYIVDIAKEVAKTAKENVNKQKAIENARNSKPPAKKKAKTTSFGPTKGNFKPDMEIFLRNPSRVPGGESHVPSDYGRGTGKSSFAYLIQRLSDRNYTMRSLCLENSGARYTSFSLPNVICRSIHWIPDTNLNDHSLDENIFDTCHTDLFHPKTGKHSLTVETLLACVKPNIECLFLTNLSSNKNACSKGIVQAIQTCSANLKCVTLNECAMSTEVVDALAKCPQLRGITFYGNETNQAANQLDSAMAKVLTSCSHLRWLYIEDFPFHGACWSALAGGACPELQLLWIDCPVHQNGRISVTAGDHDVIRRALTTRTLSLCMINPDEKLKSSFIPGDSQKEGIRPFEWQKGTENARN